MATTKISPREADSVARFAVEQYNKQQNAKLRFEGAVEVTKQVVAGTEYSITVEATDGNTKKQYAARVLESMGLKQLVSFGSHLISPKIHSHVRNMGRMQFQTSKGN